MSEGSDTSYTQGMARPEIDIGARHRAEAGRGADDARHRRRRASSAATSCGRCSTRGGSVVVLDVRGFIPEARFVLGDDADALPLELASIGDQARVLDVFRVHRPDEVVHAGMILDPAYLATNRSTAFQVNVGGVINLVEAMIAFGVPRLVNFSSIGVLPRVALRADRRESPDPPRRRRPGHRLLRLDEGRRRGDALRLPPGARLRLPHDPALGGLRARA